MRLLSALLLCIIPYIVSAQKKKPKPLIVNDLPVTTLEAQPEEPDPALSEEALQTDKKGEKYGVINTVTKKVLIPYEYEHIEKKYATFYSTSFFFKVKKNGLYGIKDITKKISIPTVYNNIAYDSKPFFPAARGGKWGIISTTGKVKVPFSYDTVFSDMNAYVVRKGQLQGIISVEGKILLPIAYTSFKSFRNSSLNETDWQLIADSHSHKGLWNIASQTLALPAVFDQITDVSNTHVIVVNAGKYGVVTTQNKPAVPFRYDYIKFLFLKDASQPLIARTGDKYGLLSSSGKELIPLQYDDLQSISAGLYKVSNAGKYKVINAAGRILTGQEYDHIGVYVNGKATAYKGQQKTFIDTLGEAGNFQPSDDLGYTDLKSLFDDFALAMNAENDSLLELFCKKVCPDKHTLDFMIQANLKYSTFITDIVRNKYTLEYIRESWFSRLQDTHRYWAANGLTGKLRYTGKEYLNTYLWNEKYAVETFMKPVFFTAGDKSVKFQPNDLTRIDGRWKAFKLPTRI
ncbi:WG repeat-containing protein [Chitinophaga tropicalis]|uniref:WG repeat protein n=1 Tax=Chitinophaga tropicalis TaxID=2683588 RepID=A0A7K1U7Q1_9BACT|nr:WG repeat-containing protein [Chitinophaga tropicalis]MVT10387.1 hypothetical protein [Chitinophaga tropicalis]